MTELRHPRPGTTVVFMPPQLDAVAAKRLREQFDWLANHAKGEIVLDFADSSFVDSSGVGAVVFLYKRLAARHVKMIANHLHGQPRRLFHVLRMDRVIACHDADTNSAAAAL